MSNVTRNYLPDDSRNGAEARRDKAFAAAYRRAAEQDSRPLMWARNLPDPKAEGNAARMAKALAFLEGVEIAHASIDPTMPSGPEGKEIAKIVVHTASLADLLRGEFRRWAIVGRTDDLNDPRKGGEEYVEDPNQLATRYQVDPGIKAWNNEPIRKLRAQERLVSELTDALREADATRREAKNRLKFAEEMIAAELMASTAKAKFAAAADEAETKHREVREALEQAEKILAELKNPKTD